MLSPGLEKTSAANEDIDLVFAVKRSLSLASNIVADWAQSERHLWHDALRKRSRTISH